MPSVKTKAQLTEIKKCVLQIHVTLVEDKIDFLTYTYSDTSTRQWAADIHTVLHMHTQIFIHKNAKRITNKSLNAPEYVGVSSNSNSQKQAYLNLE